ncbi:hypothetical protein GJ496_005346, partial [Pomphorhynchus laevis]
RHFKSVLEIFDRACLKSNSILAYTNETNVEPLQLSRSQKTFFFHSLNDVRLSEDLTRLRSKTTKDFQDEWLTNKDYLAKVIFISTF